MDPAMMSMMQEHMKRMRPEDIQRMQQMMTPEMTRMAMENMKNMRPEDMKLAAEQMKNLTPEQIAQMSNLGGPGVPPVLNQRRQYELNAAATLKNQGNQLHGAGKYDEAVDKYLRAKTNLAGHSSSEAATLRRACLVNLMSCYLKTKDYNKVVECGAEVRKFKATLEGMQALKEDPSNVKALYRRGQAFKELGNLKASVIDLKRAAELSPDDETLASVLGDVRKQMQEKGEVEEESKVVHTTDEVLIEDITDQETLSSDNQGQNTSTTLPPFSSTSPLGMNNETWQMQMEALKSNPGMIRQMQSMMANMDHETMAAVTGGAFSPEMARVAGDMMKNMSPDQLETYLQMGSSMRGAATASGNGSGVQTETETGRIGSSSSGETRAPRRGADSLSSGSNGVGAGNLSTASIGSSGLEGGAMPSMQQLQEQMKDPAMMQSMLDMMKGMPPEMMAAMGAKAGIKMTPDQARQAQESLSQMTPEQMATMMKWGERVNQVKQTVNETKNWILKRPLLILAFVILLLAIFLHYLGYIG